jgi:hypothetical protein
MLTMKKRFFLSLLVFQSLFCFAQDNFPNAFFGHWTGELLWYQTGKKMPQKVKMQLIVGTTDTTNVYRWQIIYGANNKDSRPYILRPADTSKVHWQIDEQNGIILDQYFIGNRSTCAYTVQNITIINNYWREGAKLVVEFYVASSKPINATGLNEADSIRVDNYPIQGYQRAVLTKEK